jgi:bis(5'-nucleosyl)-tetraphosphatase (symmetrical)
LATYAIGDIQGCFEPLQRLLAAIDFQPAHDQLWLTGDLVNRGPNSLEVLRWAKHEGSAVTVVLGNHDIHLLACGLGVVQPRFKDTFHEILDAPDRDELLLWLRQRPLLHRHGNHVLVHAALHASWTLDEAESHAHELESLLQGPEAHALLADSYAEKPTEWNSDLSTSARRLAALAIFTRLRCVTPSGFLTFDYHGSLDDLPEERVPWWRVQGRRSSSHRIFCGHWAAIGFHEEPTIVALDSGCVWGRSLTAYRIEDGAFFQAPAVPSSS